MIKNKFSNRPENCDFKDTSLPLVVVIAQTRWDEAPRMRHHVTQQLLRWFNVLFVEFFPTGQTEGSEWSREQDRLLVYKPALIPWPPTRLYANDPITHTIVNRSYVKKILKVIESLSANHTLLFNFVYHLPEVMQLNIFCYKAYVCFDEFPKMQFGTYKINFLKTRYQEKLFQYYENQVARNANHCFTPHYPLRDKLKKVNNNVEMLFHAHAWNTGAMARRQSGNGRIKVGFAGFIHYRLIDQWLKIVLEQRDMDLYLMGTLNAKYDIDQFAEYTNFHLLPALTEDQLLDKLIEMDVLIIPYHPYLPEVKVLTTVSKLYQYIASGKPIVTSNLINFIELPKGISYKATSSDNFIKKIRQAQAEDCEEFRELRARIASENTWNKRGEQLYRTLKDYLGDRVSEPMKEV